MRAGHTLKRRIKLAGLILLMSFPALGQGLDFAVGFTVISTYDSSRIYKPASAAADRLHFRPIDIDLWYPATPVSSDTTASFVDLANLLEKRCNFYDDTRKYDGLTEELLQYVCAGVNCRDCSVLKRIKTNSYVNAKAIKTQFPLVVYLAGSNGMSYENYLLFESLVRKGFVVASVSSIGRYPGNMTMETEDLLEQIKDAEFIIDNLTKTNFVSNDIGLIGYSWGGLAAAIMTMSGAVKIKATISLDGSEQFTYVDDEENKRIYDIRSADFFNPNLVNSPYLYLDSDIAEADILPDSVYNIADFIPGEKMYLKIDHSVHEDFSCLSILSGNDQNCVKYTLIQQLTTNYLIDKLKNQNTFYDNIPCEGLTKEFLQPTLKTTVVSTGKVSIRGVIKDKRSGLPLPYVNIGILNKETGTISNVKGEFELILSEAQTKDTLRISMIGYESRTFYLGDILKNERNYLSVLLNDKTDELEEVVVMSKKSITKVLGNKTTSKFFRGKFAPGDLGSEIVVKIKVNETPAYLNTFSFNISYNTGDTAAFRVNIYGIRNDLPDKNILIENIIVKVNGQTGKFDIDLSKFDLVVQDEFFIGLEWIEGKRNSGLVFSSGFVNRGTYYRKASQGRWRKFPMGIGFNVTVKY